MKAELTLARQNLEDLIEYARAQSLARGKPVELCSSEDGQHCDDLKVRTEWRAKLLVLSDGQVLQSKTAFSSSLRVYWLAGFDRANNLHFETSGFIGAQQGSFYLCPRAPFRYLAQALVVLRSGRLRLVDDYSMLADVCG
ncbi:MAG TPA: GspH/FimT family protein [Coxiellaceae bacterium]|nr:GspH/FimT family protein [Coxiellaceae bacterium]